MNIISNLLERRVMHFVFKFFIVFYIVNYIKVENSQSKVVKLLVSSFHTFNKMGLDSNVFIVKKLKLDSYSSKYHVHKHIFWITAFWGTSIHLFSSNPGWLEQLPCLTSARQIYTQNTLLKDRKRRLVSIQPMRVQTAGLPCTVIISLSE